MCQYEYLLTTMCQDISILKGYAGRLKITACNLTGMEGGADQRNDKIALFVLFIGEHIQLQ